MEIKCVRCGKVIAKIEKESGSLVSLGPFQYCWKCKERLFPSNIDEIIKEESICPKEDLKR